MGLFERLGAVLRREQSGQIRRLPCLHADQLITGLGCLQDANRGLTACGRRSHAGAR